MFKYVILLLLIFSQKAHSQKGIVLDRETNSPVCYANIWIANEDKGTTSDKDGFFEFKKALNNKLLIVSSLGYENRQIQVGDSILKIYLTPKSYSLNEVVVKPQQKKQNVIAEYKRSQLWMYWADTRPIILARMIPFNTEYEDQFIESIEIETFSKMESTLNMRIFDVKENGEPGEDILKKNRILKIKKGKHTTVIDIIKERKIQIDKPGLFIAFEYLITKENQNLYSCSDEDKIQRKIIGYMPMIGVLKTNEKGNNWLYCRGEWTNETTWSRSNVPFTVAMKLTLTN